MPIAIILLSGSVSGIVALALTRLMRCLTSSMMAIASSVERGFQSAFADSLTEHVWCFFCFVMTPYNLLTSAWFADGSRWAIAARRAASSTGISALDMGLVCVTAFGQYLGRASLGVRAFPPIFDTTGLFVF